MPIELEHVWRTYRVGEDEVVALNDVTTIFGDGEIASVVGPSGSGKSTFLQIAGLLDRPTAGAVRFNGRDLGSLSDADRTRARLISIGFVFQRFHLLHDLTALENVALPMEVAGVAPAARYARARALLARVGLADRVLFRPSQLSGGQRQRVAIIRAIANNPMVILADEPTGELHSEDKLLVLQLLAELNAEGRTIIVVTHDPEVASIATHRVEIRDGRLTEARL